jgi:glycosyltransferase A (GT-A) superfamily protein (DUF2064 family)
LPLWGEALFKAVFLQDRTAQRLLERFLQHNENTRIAVRRSLKTRGGRKARKVKSKKRWRLLFVVSRPQGAGFIDPRMEAQAVLTALAEVNQIEVEFLRQATFDNLINCL